MTELQPFYRGDDHALQVTVKVKNSIEPVDITGWLFTSTMKLSSELPDQPQLDESGNRVVLQIKAEAEGGDESKAGRINLIYPSSETGELIPTRYEVDIQVSRNNIIQTLIKGKIQVLADVTHGDTQ